jgi:transcriptional regulator with XRE-family HTH domain
MRFGKYFKKRRKELQLRQEDVGPFTQAYISKIEAGENNPTKFETIEKLAKGLRIPENRVKWFLVYSILDCEPEEYFKGGKALQAMRVKEDNVQYSSNEIHLPLGSSEDEVLHQLGTPDKKITIGQKSKWSYFTEGIHIILEEGKVIDAQL